MGICNPEVLADVENQNSFSQPRSLTEIIAQDTEGEVDQSAVFDNKKESANRKAARAKGQVRKCTTKLATGNV